MEIKLQTILRRLAERALQREWTAAMSIIVNEVDKGGGFIAHMVFDDLAYGRLGSL